MSKNKKRVPLHQRVCTINISISRGDNSFIFGVGRPGAKDYLSRQLAVLGYCIMALGNTPNFTMQGDDMQILQNLFHATDGALQQSQVDPDEVFTYAK
jgi:hypothetical protein